MTEPQYPGAAAPQRRHTVVSLGVRLNVLEWGNPDAPPLLLCHGMWDHALSFALLAPLLAQRYRVLALDARGHGDSGWADAYTWIADLADIINTIRWIGGRVGLVGHSKGGGQVVDAACNLDDTITAVVNIDGFGPPPYGEGEEPTPQRCTEYLNARLRLTQRPSWRPYANLEDLVERRRAQNPRLSREWLRYFIAHGARQDADGWRWKVDPLAQSGFGPWRPEWIGLQYARLHSPLLAIIGSEQDTWGPLPEAIRAERLARAHQVQHCTIDGAGHFVHIERPAATAAAILEFLETHTTAKDRR